VKSVRHAARRRADGSIFCECARSSSRFFFCQRDIAEKLKFRRGFSADSTGRRNQVGNSKNQRARRASTNWRSLFSWDDRAGKFSRGPPSFFPVARTRNMLKAAPVFPAPSRPVEYAPLTATTHRLVGEPHASTEFSQTEGTASTNSPQGHLSGRRVQ